MAITVRDIISLPPFKGLSLVSGKSGLDQFVVSSGIVEYEYSPYSTIGPEFDKESFVMSSLLFAAGREDILMTAIKGLHEQGVSALAYKRVIYDELPAEVLAYSDAVGFPIFSYGTDVYSENLIFAVMDAVKKDEASYFTPENVKAMIEGRMQPGQLESIIENAAILFKPYVCGFFVSGEGLDVDYYYRRYAMNISFTDKVVMCRYGSGLFVVTTSDSADEAAHGIIARQFMELIGLENGTFENGAAGKTAGNAAGNAVGKTAGNTAGNAVGKTAGNSVGNAVGKTAGNAAGNAVGKTAVKAGKDAGGKVSNGANVLHVCSSKIHAKEDLDLCFRESFQCYVGSAASNWKYSKYGQLGSMKILVSYADCAEAREFADEVLEALGQKPEYLETVEVLVKNGGDVMATAVEMDTHHSTIRYRLARAKAILGLEELSEMEFYKEMAIAVVIDKIRRL